MEFNTAPIWSIISILFVVTILLVVWYFYNEIFGLKNRIFSIERFLEGSREPRENEQVDWTDDEDSVEEYDEPEYQEEIQEETEDQEEIPEETIDQEDAEDQEEFLEQHSMAQTQGCVHILASGKRKGQECGKPVKEGDKCVTHC